MLKKSSVKKKLLLLILSFAILLLSFSTWAERKDHPGKSDPHPKARNIIFMVGDGMGLAHVTAARIFKNGPDGKSLHLETLPTLGYQRTHSASDSLTDSAAAASASAAAKYFAENVKRIMETAKSAALAAAPAADRERMQAIIVNPDFSLDEFETLKTDLNHHGGLAYTRQCAELHVARAKAALDVFPSSPTIDILRDIADYTLSRKA